MQGWRISMEDAHLAISDVLPDGVGPEPLSLFAVFDGHGGCEVAEFCRRHIPDEVRWRLREGFAALRARGRPLELPEEALRDSFHAIDEMLRTEEHLEELKILIHGRRTRDRRDSISPGGADVGEAEDPSTSAPPEPKEVILLRASIQQDLTQAKEKGALKKQEAMQVMMKMNLLKRLEAQQAAESAAGPVGAADSIGCTAVVVLLTAAEVLCANAGDSRAVLCRKGRAIPLSHDHKPDDDKERRRIEAAGGRVEEIPVGRRTVCRVNGNLSLSRAIGDMGFKRQPEKGPERQVVSSTPDFVRHSLTADDEFVVLACDGIWDIKSNQEVVDFVGAGLRQGTPIPAIVESLLDECMAANPKETNGLGGDNMTCVVVQLDHPRTVS